MSNKRNSKKSGKRETIERLFREYEFQGEPGIREAIGGFPERINDDEIIEDHDRDPKGYGSEHMGKKIIGKVRFRGHIDGFQDPWDGEEFDCLGVEHDNMLIVDRKYRFSKEPRIVKCFTHDSESLWAYDHARPRWEIVQDPDWIIHDLFEKNGQKCARFIKHAEIIAGEFLLDNVTFDGAIVPGSYGAPFTPLDISAELRDIRGLIMRSFGTGCEISARGYYMIDFERGYKVNYDCLRLPLFLGEDVVGEVSLYRHDNRVLSCFWRSGHTFSKIFQEYPDSEYVMLRGHGAKFAVTPDNKIHMIISSPYFYYVENQETLFLLSKTADNTFSRNADRIPV